MVAVLPCNARTAVLTFAPLGHFSPSIEHHAGSAMLSRFLSATIAIAFAASANAAPPGVTQPSTAPSAQLPAAVQEKVGEQIAVVEREIARRRTSNPAAADALANDLQRVRDHLAGRLQPADAADVAPEVH